MRRSSCVVVVSGEMYGRGGIMTAAAMERKAK